MGYNEIPPLLFAGSRYLLAFFILLPFLLTRHNREIIIRAERKLIFRILLLGLIFYTLTQGLLFLGLFYLQSATVSLILNFTPLLVAFFSGYLLNEKLSGIQWGGVMIFLSGIIIYFFPWESGSGELSGIIIMLIAVVTNALSAILGRNINRRGDIPPLIITGVSMGFGSLFLFFPAVIYYGIPHPGVLTIILFLWMVIVNTAFAFTLWNKTMKFLTATESSIINSTMLFQVAILGYIFLGEPLSIYEITGMTIALPGAVIVQLYGMKKVKLLSAEK
jgi:drug/metabolite transporter (DMT)-like permease